MNKPLPMRAMLVCWLLACGSALAAAQEPLIEMTAALQVEKSALPVEPEATRDLEHTFPGDTLALHCSLRNPGDDAIVVYWVPRQICSENVLVERVERDAPPIRLRAWDFPYRPRKPLTTELGPGERLDFVADVTHIYRPSVTHEFCGPHIVQPGKYRVRVDLTVSVGGKDGGEAKVTLQSEPFKFQVRSLSERSVDALVRVAADHRKEKADRERAAVAAVFGTTEPPGPKLLGGLMSGGTVGVKVVGIAGCVLRAAKEEQPVMVDRLESLMMSDAEHSLVRAMAMWALGEQKVAESVPLLVQLVDEKAPGSLAAIRALAAIGTPEAVAVLERIAAEEGYTPQQAGIAARVLKQMKPQAAPR